MLTNKKGFTLIELLIVVVIIGILAAIAIPKFANTKEKAYLATMKADLRNLVTAQEAYFADNAAYTDDLGTSYNTSSGVTIAISGVGPGTFSAEADYAGGTTRTCVISVGTGGNDGEPTCN
jgi:prepilin-type N-terminal cleavage/methylation domain-containing protein